MGKKKDYTIKYLRVGSKLINRHTGKLCVITEKNKYGYRILEIGDTLSTSEKKESMGLYFKKRSIHG